MSEQEQTSQLSALFDGELPSPQADLVIRRALKDAAMRQRWQRYALIGACVRGEPLVGAPGAGSLADRVTARIASEADILAPWSGAVAAGSASSNRFGRMLTRGAAGGAIAAAVAVMAVFLVRNIGPEFGGVSAGQLLASDVAGDSQSQIGDRTLSSDADSAPHSYTTPAANARLSSPLVDQPPLAHYVVAHSEKAASSLGFSYDLTEGAVVMTEDEIQAHLR